MVEFTVTRQEEGALLDRVVLRRYPTFSRNFLFRLLRKKDVRVNGARVSENVTLHEADQVRLYAEPEARERKLPEIPVLYENDWILLCEKPQGLLSEPDGSGAESLLSVLNRRQSCALCHRLDRNTGGLIFLCKQAAFTEAISEVLADRYYRKIYRTVVLGDLRDCVPEDGAFHFLHAFHFKDSREGKVYIYREARPHTKPIETGFRFLSYDAERDVSEAEVCLVTGRTHQIRAHAAFLGHPVAGDGKYGVETRNRPLGYRYQALWAERYEPAESRPEDRRIQGVAITEILPDRVFLSKPDFH